MKAKVRAVLIAALFAAQSAQAFQLSLPSGAEKTAEKVDPAAEYGIATGPAEFGSDAQETSQFGQRTQSSWRVPQGAPNSAVLARALNDQLVESGVEILFDCSGPACGGFDFRSGRAVLPMPDMFVDLALYHYVSARLPAEDEDEATLLEFLTSESPGFLHVQMTRIDPVNPTTVNSSADTTLPGSPERTTEESVATDAAQGTVIVTADPGAVATLLLRDGHATLDGLEFASGTANLTTENVPVLAELAAYLAEDPTLRIALVGHSDWTGDPAANKRLSEARATAVLNTLVKEYSVPRRQLEVFGAGDLLPRTSNATEDGRSRNRRVDAVARPPFRE